MPFKILLESRRQLYFISFMDADAAGGMHVPRNLLRGDLGPADSWKDILFNISPTFFY